MHVQPDGGFMLNRPTANSRSIGKFSSRSWTFDGAEELALAIQEYWLAKGHVVEAWVEPVPGFSKGKSEAPIYQVRSDLTNVAPSAQS
jgi:hypothetical protein